jgi:hypothetical protein
MNAVNFSEWTIADWVARVPVTAWWWVLGSSAAIFCAGFGLGRWLEMWKRENIAEQLERVRVDTGASVVVIRVNQFSRPAVTPAPVTQ